MSLIIGEMQTKTMRYNFVPLWVSTVQKKRKKEKKKKEKEGSKCWSEQKLQLYTSSGNEKWYSHYGKWYAIPQKH